MVLNRIGGLLLVTWGASAADVRPPHIIFAMVDDVGSSDFSYASKDIGGAAMIPTPNLDELSAAGIRFSAHYAHPTCTPSRAALMTGRYASNVGLALAMFPGSVVGLPDEYPTLPEMLKKEGYDTHMVGKWHLGHSKWRQTPVGRGFDTHVGCFMWDIDSYTKQMWLEPWRPSMSVDWIRANKNGSFVHFLEKRHATEAIADETIKRIQSQDPDSPLFLYVAFTAAHSPLQPMPQHLAKCKHIPHSTRREFCGMVVGLDEAIASITAAAKTHLGESTVIVVSSDNGGSTWFGGGNAPLRGGKHVPFEGGVLVPTFAMDLSSAGSYFGPGVGRYYRGLAHTSDWFPTLLGLAKGSSDMKGLKLDGINLGPALRAGGDVEVLGGPRHEILVDMYYGSLGEYVWPDDDMAVIRRGKWKLVDGYMRDPHWYSESTSNTLVTTDTTWKPKAMELLLRAIVWIFGEGPADNTLMFFAHNVLQGHYHSLEVASGVGATKLYNVVDDPRELVDVAKDFPDVVAELQKRAAVLRDARPEQQKFWFTVQLPEEYQQNLVPGECYGLVPESECKFVHPWLADDADVTKLRLLDGMDDAQAKSTRARNVLLAACCAILLMCVCCCRCLCSQGGGKRKRE